MTQNEKYSWLSLISTGFIFWYFQMRMLDGWHVANVSPKHMMYTYISVVVLFIVLESIIAGFIAARGGGNNIEKDERDLLIEARAEQYSVWFLSGTLNLVILSLLANAAYKDHIFPKFELASLPALFFHLFALLIATRLVTRISILVMYAMQRAKN